MLSLETSFGGDLPSEDLASYFNDTSADEFYASASASPLPSVDEVPSSAEQSPKMTSSQMVDIQQLQAAQAAIAAMATASAYQQTLHMFGVANPLLSPSGIFDQPFAGLPLLTGLHAASAVTSPTLSPVSSVSSLDSHLPLLRDIPLAPGFGASSLASTPGFTSTATTAPGSPVPMSPSEVETHLEMMSGSAFGSDVGAGGHGKAKKKRRPKPRMHELSTEQAEAKRNANRESARKCRERKRQRERFVVGEKEQLSNEIQSLRIALAAERSKTELLEKLLSEFQAAQPLFGVV